MKKSILWIIIGVVGLFIALPSILQYFYPGGSLNYRGGCSMWSGHLWMGGMWLFPLIMLFVILMLVSSIFGRRNVTPSGNHSIQEKPETAQNILKKRYAKGEITKEEFETIKQELNS